jgi:hypothetical protein
MPITFVLPETWFFNFLVRFGNRENGNVCTFLETITILQFDNVCSFQLEPNQAGAAAIHN